MTNIQSSKIHAMMACGVGLLAIASLFLAWQIEDERRSSDATSQLAVTEPIDEQRDFDIPKSATLTKRAQLIGVEHDVYSGIAKHWEDGGVFKFRALVTLPQPQRGTYYEAWIIGKTTISAGRLNPDRPGVWVANFQSSESLYDYKKIIITEESAANSSDGVPEKTLLEGDF